MTKHVLLLSAVALLAACSNDQYKSYGSAITDDDAMSVADFGKAIEGKDSLDAKLACEITASCAKKGCWMDVKMADGNLMKVHFKDYEFFVPTSGLEGKQAVIQGRAVKEVTDVATLRHYAEDEGKTKEECEAITEPETSWSFTADGVLIKD
jgi:hypothetical protein